MDLEQIKDSIIQIMSKHPVITVKYLSHRLNESRPKIKYVLTHNECFTCIYRTPINTYHRRRPIWTFTKVSE